MNDYVLNVLELTLFNNGITVESHYLGDGQWFLDGMCWFDTAGWEILQVVFCIVHLWQSS